MFSEQLKKILNLIKKTGDGVVIYDANTPENSYVVMDFDRYASMVMNEKSIDKLVSPVSPKTENTPINNDKTENKENLTEEDLTDKINREISTWKNRENAPFLAEEDKPKKPWSIPQQVKSKAQDIE